MTEELQQMNHQRSTKIVNNPQKEEYMRSSNKYTKEEQLIVTTI